jgi:hypothetical protein
MRSEQLIGRQRAAEARHSWMDVYRSACRPLSMSR